MGSINKQNLCFGFFFLLTKLKPRVTIFTIGVKWAQNENLVTGDSFSKIMVEAIKVHPLGVERWLSPF